MNSMENNDRNGRRPALEWVVGVISAMVVFGILAFLSYEALVGDAQPPDLVASIDRVEEIAGGTLIVVTLSNRGDQAAAEITVGATVEGGGDEQKQTEIRFDYVASHAVRRGAFILAGPAVTAEDVRLRVHGYVEP